MFPSARATVAQTFEARALARHALGQRHRPILGMPRARLCQISKSAGEKFLNAGFSELLDISDSDAAILAGLDFVKETISWQELRRYRFHIDIDGHASSFAGLFLKLLSGGVVLKVNSPDGFAQWYADRLRPWVNFIPVRSDLTHLIEIISYCHKHDETAQRIAGEGQKLALSMTYRKEFALALDRVAEASALR